MKFFENAKRLSDMTQRADRLEAELQEAKAGRRNAEAELERAFRAKNEMESRYNELIGKLREQTDADLLKVSLKIIIDTIERGKPLKSDIALQQSLLSQQASFSNLGVYGLGLGNLLGLAR